MKTELEKRVLKCMNEALSDSLETIKPETDLRDDLEMDSMDLVILQVELEQEFQFNFDPIEDDFVKIFQTFGSLCHYLENSGRGV